jgi:hypothetical protein
MNIEAQVQVPLIGDVTTCHAGLTTLFRFEQACRQHYDCTIFVNTQRLRWLDANLCAVLHASLYRLHHEHRLQFTFDKAALTGRLAILARNGFIGAQDINLTDGYGSTVRLQAFRKEEDEAYIEYIEQKLLNHSSLQLHPDVRSDLMHSFTEVFANVNLHANTDEPLFTCGQHYHRKGKLCFSLADIGVGYLNPIQRQRPDITTSAQAIVWAIGAGHTTRQLESDYFGVTGGDGLTSLHDHCRNNGGELQIITGNAFWSSKQPNFCYIIEPFQGSIVNIIVPCPK